MIHKKHAEKPYIGNAKKFHAVAERLQGVQVS